MRGQSVLISGVGIAGPALAYWLLRFGFTPTLVERAPALRTGGYVIDFWGAGFDVVEKMGLLPDVLAAGYDVRELRMLAPDGAVAARLDAAVVSGGATGRFTSLPRGELGRVLHAAIAGRAEVLFGDSVASIDDDGDAARVRFAGGAERSFDLVVGADGLHSAVRDVVFGPEAGVERYLGFLVAAFSISGYRPRDEDVYVLYNVPGAMIGRFSMRDDQTMVLMVVADADPPAFTTDDERKAYLRARFAGARWESEAILRALDAAADLYFDRVSQITMERWTKGRVALIGDAAHCVSLLAGQGSALALVDAYVLAVALATAGSHEAAFASFEARLMPFMAAKQRAARRFAGSFAPRTRVGLQLRNVLMRALQAPLLARLSVGSSFVDKIELPPLPVPRGNVGA